MQAPDVLGFSCTLLPADHLRLFSLVRSGKEHRGVDLISDALPFARLSYGEPNAAANAIGYAMHRSRSHDVVIRVFDGAGDMIEAHGALIYLHLSFSSARTTKRLPSLRCAFATKMVCIGVSENASP